MENKEKQNLEKGVRDLVASDLPVSEVIGTLTKRVLESETNLESWDWLLMKSFGEKLVFDGTKDFNYAEYLVDASGNPYDDTVIADFNSNNNEALRETVAATKQSNVKTKIIDAIMHNFKTNPTDTISAVFTNTQNIVKVQGLIIENEYWARVEETAFVIDTTNDENDIATNKVIYEVLLKLTNTSKTHESIGTDGVINIGGDTINPSHKFETSDFIYITSPSFQTATVFDGERSFFNWSGSSLPIGKHLIIDNVNYEGIATANKDFYVDYKAILIHKKALEIILDWQGSKVVQAPKLYQIVHNYLKYESYKRLDKPIIIFKDVPEPLMAKIESTRKISKEKIEKILKTKSKK